MEKGIILENEKVKLEPLQMSHFNELATISSEHPNLLQHSPSLFGTDENLKSYIADAIQQRELGNRFAFAIYDKSNKRFIGSSSYGAISHHDKKLEIGWTWIDKAVQGSGLNKQVKFLMLDYAFNTLEMERVEFKTDSRNIQSKKALVKIGATFEGELRRHMLMPDGFRRTSSYYSILKSEWIEIKKTIFQDY
ncbi:MAG: RimJ/RimL family protein N-acetyltransferase [Crocinitomicaceae bacterium]